MAVVAITLTVAWRLTRHGSVDAFADGAQQKPVSTNLLSQPTERHPLDLKEADRKKKAHGIDDDFLSDPIASDAEIIAYLEKEERSRSALLAIGLLTDDDELLREAAIQSPDDPHLQFLVITRDLFPDEKGEWLARFSAAQPDNSLAKILAGGYALEQDLKEEGVAMLEAAASMAEFNDFSNEQTLLADETLMDLGHGSVRAKFRSTLAMRSVGSELMDTFTQLRATLDNTKDGELRNHLAVLGTSLANKISQGDPSRLLINQVIGTAHEANFLKKLAPDFTSESLAAPAGELVEQLDAERKELFEFIKISDQMTELSEDELGQYIDRVRIDGEMEAMRWAAEKLKRTE
jgi:hypothetical protein